jgi:hypothetical protein
MEYITKICKYSSTEREEEKGVKLLSDGEEIDTELPEL